MLRIVIGEPTIGLPSIVNVYKNKEESKHLLFPVKTALMVVSLITLLATSCISKMRHGGNNQNVQEKIAFDRSLAQEITSDASPS